MMDTGRDFRDPYIWAINLQFEKGQVHQDHPHLACIPSTHKAPGQMSTGFRHGTNFFMIRLIGHLIMKSVYWPNVPFSIDVRQKCRLTLP